jgi:hypothetical protein
MMPRPRRSRRFEIKEACHTAGGGARSWGLAREPAWPASMRRYYDWAPTASTSKMHGPEKNVPDTVRMGVCMARHPNN